MGTGPEDWQDRILRFVELFFENKWMDWIHLTVMALAVLYFGAHILWWWLR